MNIWPIFSEKAIQIISILGALYILIKMFIDDYWPDIIAAREQEIEYQRLMKKENSDLDVKNSENQQIVLNTKTKIIRIEQKIEKWLNGIKASNENVLLEMTRLNKSSSLRKETINQNLNQFYKAKVVVDKLKTNILQKLNTLVPGSVIQEKETECSVESEDFSTITSSFGRTSFIYAKVFLAFLKKHSLPIPETDFLISLSQMFKSNDFFFFAKGGLLEPMNEKTKKNAEKICVFSCKKFLKSESDKNCCLCCYQWPEMLEKIKIDKYLQRFLEIIIAKDAQKIISDVLKELAFLIYSNKGQVLCEIESVKELEPEEIAKICDNITQLYKLTPVCIFKINPCLIGGVLIKSNLFRMDNSTYGYLNKVFYKLDAIKA